MPIFIRMTTTIIIALCIILLIAYLFDLTSSKTKIPSVILLLLLGWSARQLTDWLHIQLPDFSPVLPVLGTIGLILIVLEGSLDLELNKSKLGLIKKSFFGALFPLIALSILLAFAFMYYGGFSFKNSLINAIPFSVISSAIAIPSVRNLNSSDKEFVVYESSLSDIIGVLIFNFVALNESINAVSIGQFALQLLLIAAISLLATLALSFLLNRIQHHIKFIPIILLVVLIYAVSKIYHLPGLLFILFFGLTLNNIDELKHFRWIEKFKPDELNKEIVKFKEITVESVFLVRALFFLLFGYLIETNEVINKDSLAWSVPIVFIIFLFRAIQLRFSKLSLQPLLFIAPRGLITILLFLSIAPSQSIGLVNKSLVIQVILLTAFILMLGLVMYKPKK